MLAKIDSAFDVAAAWTLDGTFINQADRLLVTKPTPKVRAEALLMNFLFLNFILGPLPFSILKSSNVTTASHRIKLK